MKRFRPAKKLAKICRNKRLAFWKKGCYNKTKSKYRKEVIANMNGPFPGVDIDDMIFGERGTVSSER